MAEFPCTSSRLRRQQQVREEKESERWGGTGSESRAGNPHAKDNTSPKPLLLYTLATGLRLFGRGYSESIPGSRIRR